MFLLVRAHLSSLEQRAIKWLLLLLWLGLLELGLVVMLGLELGLGYYYFYHPFCFLPHFFSMLAALSVNQPKELKQ